MHDNIKWYRSERARTLPDLKNLVAETQSRPVESRNAALVNAARELASALDFVDLQMDRLVERSREP